MLEQDGLDWDGYIYYPNQCIENNGAARCKIHFAMHGCTEQINSQYGWEWINRSGYNEYAVTNNLIIVYPVIYWNIAFFHLPCFNIVGEIDKENYLFKDGVQQKAFMKMVDRLVKPMDTNKYDYTKLNLNTNYLELIWSEFWRYTFNGPVLALLYIYSQFFYGY